MKNPIFDIDNWKEITATLGRNKTRTFLTAFGIFWGTAMLAMLWGGAQGFQDLLRRNFAGFSTNTALVFAGNTSIPYKGFSKGMWWSLTQTDIDNMRKSIPEISASSAVTTYSTTAIHGDKSYATQIQGIESQYPLINKPVIYEGRFINDSDGSNDRKVCVLGKRVAAELFGTGSPIGKFVALDNIYYRVVGVAGQTSEININGKIDEMVLVPHSTMQRAYNIGQNVGMVILSCKNGTTPTSIRPRIERIIRASHPIHPEDTQAIEFWDVSEEFAMVENVFSGVDILVLFVGFGSLLAGIIGVGNIMWIIVKERTQEIGVRRAIGAKPHDIIMQILSESIVLTTVAGIAGICFAVIVLHIVAIMTTEDGNTPGFQLTFMNAMTILVVFLTLGSAAGIVPAIKAMRIKPIEALNDK